MDEKQLIRIPPYFETDRFPNAVRVGDTIYTSGMVAINEQFEAIAPGDVVGQADAIFARMATLLEAAGSDMKHVLKINAYLVNRDDYAAYNEARHRWFPESPPASATVIVAGLVKEALVVEIEAVAQAIQ